jgi:hypothetical protein
VRVMSLCPGQGVHARAFLVTFVARDWLLTVIGCLVADVSPLQSPGRCDCHVLRWGR